MNRIDMNLKALSILAILTGFSTIGFAQDYEPSEERSSFDNRQTSIMDGNLLRATYHNTGHAGRRNSSSLDELLFEFPRNTNREYMYFMSTMFGTEVPNQATAEENDTFRMVDVASYRTSRNGRTNWSLNPIVGYNRDDANEIARSDRGPESSLGNTWPDVWPDKLLDGGDGWGGSWNGFFGRDQFNADVEFYYKAGDDTYTKYINGEEFKFQPDETDPTRGGLGIILDTRVLAWSQALVSATHFNIFEIKNDASFDYPRMAFGLWIADFVAGGGSGNKPVFDNIRSIAYLTEIDRESGGSVFGDGKIGEMGLKFLETPGNATDGIDNDSDSDTYNPLPVAVGQRSFYDPDNVDLYTPLTTNGGGFYSYEALRDTVIKLFEAEDFDARTINIGDKIVLIQEDASRVVTTYDGSAFISQGITWDFGGAVINVEEDLIPEDPAEPNVHIDGLDNDFDGLIDENRPNHLLKTTFINNAEIDKSVRFINYLSFEVGDTLSRGLIVPNQTIRERIANDSDFADMVNNEFGGRLQNFNTSAPMIDEARDDFFDNDNDWNQSLDDVGIEGDPDNSSEGAGDGLPSSGAGTTFPGESSIDKTDVSETDLIGVSRITIFDAGALLVDQDSDIWISYLIPGEFVEEVGTDSDIFVSSGLFPLAKGASERFAVAVTAVQTNSPTAQGDRDQTNRNLDQATDAYEADYQFAVAPRPPVLTAVAGDGRVTLYWDSEAENTFDRYISRTTGNGNDFEGYKVYRTTDVSFEEIRSITDGFGTSAFFSPIKTFDLEDGLQGFHPVPVNGVQYNLGTDSGLQRFYEDTTVVNGRKYFYAVVAYDFGLTSAGIAPSESPVKISLNPNGTIELGENVVEVRPSRDRAGYISPDKPDAAIVQGAPGGTVNVKIIDPSVLKADNLYDVVFEDTLISGGVNQDTIRTKNFSLRNVTSGNIDTLISRSTEFNGESLPITEGFTVTLNNIEEFGLNTVRSGWVFDHAESPHDFSFAIQAAPKVSDYDIIVGDVVGFGQSTEKNVEVAPGFFQTLPSVPTNFKIFNSYTEQEIDFAYGDLNVNNSPQQRCNPTIIIPGNYTPPAPGELSAVSGFNGRCSDVLFFIEDFRGVEDTLTYRVELSPNLVEGNLATIHPQSGDTLKIFTTKPFSQNDKFQFRFDQSNIPRIDTELATSQLDDILVIPNPYVVTNIYESASTQTDKQQKRELHFTGIPAPSTLRIFTASGVLVKEIYIEESDLTSDFGGSYIWNMLTKDNLEISYGIYLYHIEARGVGEKLGKFAVIK